MTYSMGFRLIVIFAALILSGCSTTAGYKKNVDSYTGKPVSVLLQNWGAPDASVDHEGKQYLTYYRTKQILIATGGQAIGKTRDCKTIFVVSDGVVLSSAFKGELCRE